MNVEFVAEDRPDEGIVGGNADDDGVTRRAGNVGQAWLGSSASTAIETSKNSVCMHGSAVPVGSYDPALDPAAVPTGVALLLGFGFSLVGLLLSW